MSEFVGYVGHRSIHDSVVLALNQRADSYEVLLETEGGAQIEVEFRRVHAIRAEGALEMLVYALSEFSVDDGPGRRFVFAPSDDRTSARLEVTAETFECRTVAP